MADVSKTPTWWTGGRREIKMVLHDAEIEGLLTTLRKADTAFGRDLLAKIERALDGT